MLQVVTLVVGGSMALNGQVNPEQLTTFVLYVEFVTAASLSVCDQWGPLMEAIGASERVMYYLDKPSAPQIASGRKLPSWSGKVPCSSDLILYLCPACIIDVLSIVPMCCLYNLYPA